MIICTPSLDVYRKICDARKIAKTFSTNCSIITGDLLMLLGRFQSFNRSSSVAQGKRKNLHIFHKMYRQKKVHSNFW